MSGAAEGRYYVAAVQPADARDAIIRWLTSGRLRIADPSRIKIQALRLAYLPFCRVECSYTALWQGDIGEVDQGSFIIAQNQYHMAVQHYESLPEHVQRRVRTYHIPPKPKEQDFVRWWSRSGHLTGQWASETFMCASAEEYGLDARVKAWAGDLKGKLQPPQHAIWYSTLASWAQYAGESRDALLPFPPDGRIATQFIDRITDNVRREFLVTLPKYYQGIQIALDRDRSELRIADRMIIPVYIVNYMVGEKAATCLADAVSATTVIGMQIRDIKGAIGRFFRPITSIFQKRPGPPRLLTYDGEAESKADVPEGTDNRNGLHGSKSASRMGISRDISIDIIDEQTIRSNLEYTALFELAKQAGIFTGGLLKEESPQEGKIILKSKYGISFLGIRVEVSVRNIGGGVSQVSAKGWLPESFVDWTNAAPKRAQLVLTHLVTELGGDEGLSRLSIASQSKEAHRRTKTRKWAQIIGGILSVATFLSVRPLMNHLFSGDVAQAVAPPTTSVSHLPGPTSDVAASSKSGYERGRRIDETVPVIAGPTADADRFPGERLLPQDETYGIELTRLLYGGRLTFEFPSCGNEPCNVRLLSDQEFADPDGHLQRILVTAAEPTDSNATHVSQAVIGMAWLSYGQRGWTFVLGSPDVTSDGAFGKAPDAYTMKGGVWGQAVALQHSDMHQGEADRFWQLFVPDRKRGTFVLGLALQTGRDSSGACPISPPTVECLQQDFSTTLKLATEKGGIAVVATTSYPALLNRPDTTTTYHLTAASTDTTPPLFRSSLVSQHK